MAKTIPDPIAVRFPASTRRAIRSTARKTNLTQQAVIRLAVVRGLPLLLSLIGKN